MINETGRYFTDKVIEIEFLPRNYADSHVYRIPEQDKYEAEYFFHDGNLERLLFLAGICACCYSLAGFLVPAIVALP